MQFGYKLIILLHTLLTVSCSSSSGNESTSEPKLSLNPTTLNYESGSRKGNIEVKSNGEWSVSSDAQWLTFVPESGTGNGNITISLTANEGSATREGNITVSQYGVEPQKTFVSQLGEDPDIRISPSSGSVPAAGGELTFTVTSNVGWSVEIAQTEQSWISVVPNGTKAMEDKACTLKIGQNSGAARTATVSIKSTDGKVSRKYSIEQEKGEFLLQQDEFILPPKQNTLEVPIQANGEYEISTPAGWITLDRQASTQQKAVLTLLPNTSDEARSAQVALKLTAAGAEEKLFTVMQYGEMLDLRIGDDLSVGPLAFPGAEGGGRMTTGGRGGKVYIVTSLSDDNVAGTLRYAVNQSGKRTVVFAVSGTIHLKSNMSIRNGDLTIAGQTAPGDGICLRGYELNVGANNVIIRFIRARLGDDNDTEADAMGGRYATNVIVDHCSASWSVDECISFYANTNFTLQWCIASESLRNSAHAKGAHGYGGIWGGKNASFHHNIMAHHDSRNPRIQGVSGTTSGGVSHAGAIDLRNNVIYNWGGNSAYGGEEQQLNFVNCYYKPGPATSKKERIYSPDSSTKTGSDEKDFDAFGRFYINGNYVYNSQRATDDNWTYGVWSQLHSSYNGISEAQKQAMKIDQPHPFDAVTTHAGANTLDIVVKYAGASLHRDAVDERLADEITTGTATYKGSVSGTPGIIDKVSDVGGYPQLKSLPALADTDKDGIPDVWEDAYGLDKNNANDAALYTLDPAGRYTNLEAYLHHLVQHIVKSQNVGGVLTGTLNGN